MTKRLMEVGATVMTLKARMIQSLKIICLGIIQSQAKMIQKVNLKIRITTIRNIWTQWIILEKRNRVENVLNY